ncbi:MAG: RNA methyltransferase [Spirochaetes bacterium]|nr:RNA methyltransferase [Spirochaetota bacterium]
MASSLSDIAIVLCGIREPGNVGSICRAMKTMGIGRLFLAACPDYDEARLRSMAVHSEDIYEKALRFKSLGEALAGFSFSAGFTRRLGERRKRVSRDVESFAAAFAERAPAPLGLVFGSERSGLSDAELKICTIAVHIPTSEACPSLNVAQAVQIACWELASALRRAEPANTRAFEAKPVQRSAIENEVSGLLSYLGSIGFFKKSDENHVGEFLRDICERAALDETELVYLGRLFRKTGTLSSGPDRRKAL